MQNSLFTLFGYIIVFITISITHSYCNVNYYCIVHGLKQDHNMADYSKDAGQGIQSLNERDVIRVAVDIALFTIREGKFQILLIKRGIPPFLVSGLFQVVLFELIWVNWVKIPKAQRLESYGRKLVSRLLLDTLSNLELTVIQIGIPVIVLSPSPIWGLVLL